MEERKYDQRGTEDLLEEVVEERKKYQRGKEDLLEAEAEAEADVVKQAAAVAAARRG